MSERQLRQCIHTGRRIHVRGIDRAHPSARRLMTMGLDKGCDLQVERVSPFGDPYIVKVRGYNLAVRRKDLEALEVEEKEETGATSL
jgi:ferrous iron transport protein A